MYVESLIDNAVGNCIITNIRSLSLIWRRQNEIIISLKMKSFSIRYKKCSNDFNTYLIISFIGAKSFFEIYARQFKFKVTAIL